MKNVGELGAVWPVGEYDVPALHMACIWSSRCQGDAGTDSGVAGIDSGVTGMLNGAGSVIGGLGPVEVLEMSGF